MSKPNILIALQKFVNEQLRLDKSVVNRYQITTYFTIKDGNILCLGEEIPEDAVDSAPTEDMDKYILLLGKGEYTWDLKYEVETLEGAAKTTRDKAQSRAIQLVEANKNTIKQVVVCELVQKTFADRFIYKGFVTYSHVSKEDEEKLMKTVEGDSKMDKVDSDDNTTIEKSESIEHMIPITKSSLVEGLVYGIVYEPMQKDTHDDWSTAEEIQKMCHGFLPNAIAANGEWTDKNHSEKIDKRAVDVVESYIAPCDFTLASGEKVVKGSWVLVAKVNSANLKKAIETGEVTGFSLEGVGKRLPMDMPS